MSYLFILNDSLRANLSRIAKRLISQLRSTQSHAAITGIYTAMRALTSNNVPERVRSVTPELYVLYVVAISCHSLIF
jgi:hypothetical protein